jgi:hypothetical protein
MHHKYAYLLKKNKEKSLNTYLIPLIYIFFQYTMLKFFAHILIQRNKVLNPKVNT